MHAFNIKTWWGAVLLLIMVFSSSASAQERQKRNQDVPSIVQNVPEDDINLVLAAGGLGYTTVTHGEEPSLFGGAGYGEARLYVNLTEGFGDKIDLFGTFAGNFGKYSQTSDQRYQGETGEVEGGIGIRNRDIDGYVDGYENDPSYYSHEISLSLGYHKDRGRNHAGSPYSGRHESIFAHAKWRLELFWPLFITRFGISEDWTKWPGAEFPSQIYSGFLPKLDLRAEYKWDLSVHRHSTPSTRQKNKWLLVQPRVHLWRFTSVPENMMNESMHWLDIILIPQLQGEIAYGFLNNETRQGHWTYRLGIGAGFEYNLFMGSEDGMSILTVWGSAMYSEAQNGRNSEDIMVEFGISINFGGGVLGLSEGKKFDTEDD